MLANNSDPKYHSSTFSVSLSPEAERVRQDELWLAARAPYGSRAAALGTRTWLGVRGPAADQHFLELFDYLLGRAV